MSAKLSLRDLPPDARRQVLERAGRKRAPGSRTFTAEHERRYALKLLAVIADLTQAQRRRVLGRAVKVNAV